MRSVGHLVSVLGAVAILTADLPGQEYFKLRIPSPVQHYLKLRIPSPVAAWNLSPTLGIPEDSLTRLGRGVWIHELKVGTGELVSPNSEITVHFIGYLTDGQIFSATSEDPYVTVLGVGGVIAGWEDGIPGMRVGGRRQLLIPSHLGYGVRGNEGIPPDSPLMFDVVVLNVEKP